MQLQINGKRYELQVTLLNEVVDHFNLQDELVVTEIDGEIIDREGRENCKLKDGMKIELVHFVGGG